MAESKKTRAVHFRAEMDREFQQFRDERDMTTSEALRTLVRDGLEEDDDPAVPNSADGIASLAITFASSAFIFGILSLGLRGVVAAGAVSVYAGVAVEVGSFFGEIAAVSVAIAIGLTVFLYKEGGSE